MRHLVTGSINPVLDEILSHGRQPYGTKETPGIAAMRNRCRVEQRALTDPIFNHGVSASLAAVVSAIYINNM